MRRLLAPALCLLLLAPLPLLQASGLAYYERSGVIGPGVYDAGYWQIFHVNLVPGDVVTAEVSWDESKGLIDGYITAPFCAGCPMDPTEWPWCHGDGFGPLASSPQTISRTAGWAGTHRVILRPVVAAEGVPYHVKITVNGAPGSGVVAFSNGLWFGGGSPDCTLPQQG